MTVLADFISGVSVGIELYTGKDVFEGDKFALTLDLFIIRFTLIIHKKED